MNQSFFKDILEQEIHSVFLTPAEFGESVTLEGKTLDAVVDRPEMAWPKRTTRPAFPTGLWCCSWPCPTSRTSCTPARA